MSLILRTQAAEANPVRGHSQSISYASIMCLDCSRVVKSTFSGLWFGRVAKLLMGVSIDEEVIHLSRKSDDF